MTHDDSKAKFTKVDDPRDREVVIGVDPSRPASRKSEICRWSTMERPTVRTYPLVDPNDGTVGSQDVDWS